MKWRDLNLYQSGKQSKSKYKNVRTEYNGQHFDSKVEAHYCAILDLQRKGHVISYYLRQVRIDLPGGVTMRVDFLLVYPDGTMRYIDVKGAPPTQDWINKRKQAEALYPIKIEPVDKNGNPY